MLQRTYVTPYVIFKLLDLEEQHSNIKLNLTTKCRKSNCKSLEFKILREARKFSGTKGFPGPLELLACYS